jgi:hypothetical protein
MLWTLLEQFWPVIGAAIALLAGWLGLKAKAASDRRQGRAEAMQEQEKANATAIMDRARSDADVVRGGAGAARDQLRRGWADTLRRVDGDRR